jgi:cation diffusion facilitator CzcD-associated flavoprotein CzcO
MNSAIRPMACIIGAGPYGLAIAAHLQFLGVNFRIFGRAMHRWLRQMPNHMLLKSEGCASSLASPTGRQTLACYCNDQGLPYADYGTPVSREVFAQYALSFQKQLVPVLEDVMVTTVNRSRNGFELQLSSGEILEAAKVIVATGMEHTAYIPEQLATLPAELLSHSAEHYDLSGFNGKDVTVIGGGQSALETAAILKEEGASVSLLVRGPTLAWNRIPSKAHRTMYQRFRYPRTKLGDGLQLWVYDNAPGLFHRLPRGVRHSKVRAALGPAGAWWLKDRVVGRLSILLGHHVVGSEARDGRAALRMTDQNERSQVLITDHVIAATGYQFKIQNLPFLSQDLKIQLRHEQQSPVLSPNFESSISGLYFTGLASANAFGPVMRFVAGTSYTARRLSTHIALSQHCGALPFALPEKCPEFRS